MVRAALLLIISFFFLLNLIKFIRCFLKDSQNFFMQSLPLYTSCADIHHMLLNEEIEKPDEMCLFTFVVNEFSGLFSGLNSNILVFSKGIITLQKSLFSYSLLWD